MEMLMLILVFGHSLKSRRIHKGFDYNDGLVHHTLVFYPIKTILIRNSEKTASLRFLHKPIVNARFASNATSSEKNNGHKISILNRDQSINLMHNKTIILCFW